MQEAKSKVDFSVVDSMTNTASKVDIKKELDSSFTDGQFQNDKQETTMSSLNKSNLNFPIDEDRVPKKNMNMSQLPTQMQTNMSQQNQRFVYLNSDGSIQDNRPRKNPNSKTKAWCDEVYHVPVHIND